MKQQTKTVTVFCLCLIGSLVLFTFSLKNTFGGFGILGNALFPVEQVIFQILTIPQHLHNPSASLKKTIAAVQNMADYNQLKADNAAFRDQFATSATNQLDLLPAKIIGAPAFLPGVSMPDGIVVDQGANVGVKKGQAVIYQNVLVGVVTQVRPTAALVSLLTNSDSSFTARTSTTNALGVIRGTGQGDMVLGNVLLSDELHMGDVIVTSMGEDMNGTGFPPGLLIGQITSVEKIRSSLFQSARVKTIVDVTKLAMVFIVKGQK